MNIPENLEITDSDAKFGCNSLNKKAPKMGLLL